MAYLPSEILFLIAENVVSQQKNSTVLAYPADHVITKTLASLSLVSRDLNRRATQLLYAHCLYIDTDWRLACLTRTWGNASSTNYLNSMLSTAASSKSGLGLFLAPFPDDDLDKPVIVNQVVQLFNTLAPYLTRLTIEMPLRFMWPDDDHQNIRPGLRRAFEGLVNLQEFCSIRDELFLRLTTPGDDPDPEKTPFWATSWPKLQRLSLYNVDLSNEKFLRALWSCPGLKTIVLPRVDGIEIDMVNEFARSEFENSVISLPGPCPELEMLVVNTAEEHDYYSEQYFFEQQRLENNRVGYSLFQFLRDKVTSRSAQRQSVELPIIVTVPKNRDEDVDDIELCQNWVKQRVLDGTLWNVGLMKLSM